MTERAQHADAPTKKREILRVAQNDREGAQPPDQVEGRLFAPLRKFVSFVVHGALQARGKRGKALRSGEAGSVKCEIKKDKQQQKKEG